MRFSALLVVLLAALYTSHAFKSTFMPPVVTFADADDAGNPDNADAPAPAGTSAAGTPGNTNTPAAGTPAAGTPAAGTAGTSGPGHKEKIIPLQKTPQGFVCHIDLENKGANTDDGLDNVKDPKIRLALYSSSTFVVPAELTKNGGDPTKHPSSKGDNAPEAKVAYPYFHLTGKPSSLPLYLDYNHWITNDPNNEVIIASECKGHDADICNTEGLGLLGLGKIPKVFTEGDHKTEGFALYKSDKNDDFRLVFNPNKEHCHSPAAFPAADNWVIEDIEDVQVDDKSVDTTKAKVIFDINFPSVGLPKQIFDTVVASLKEHHGLECSPGTEGKLKCKNTKKHEDIFDFPVIKLSIGTEGKKNLALTPNAYLDFVDNKENVMVNLRSIDKDATTQDNYVTTEFDNTIILGSEFLNEAYTIFNYDAKTVTFCDVETVNHEDHSTSSNPHDNRKPYPHKQHTDGEHHHGKGGLGKWWYVIGFIGILVIAAVAYVVYTRQKANQLAGEDLNTSSSYAALARA